jgi:hypothetical protein
VYLEDKPPKNPRVPEFYIMLSLEQSAQENIQKGDVVEYEEGGVNFGYFVRKVRKLEARTNAREDTTDVMPK